MGPDLDWNAVCQSPENRWPGGLSPECGGLCCAGSKKDVYSPSFVNQGENIYAVGIYRIYCLRGVSNTIQIRTSYVYMDKPTTLHRVCTKHKRMARKKKRQSTTNNNWWRVKLLWTLLYTSPYKRYLERILSAYIENV